ncbi:hypothetical protein CO670_30380 [Rhizobium sp. J15]|nr:hypothetical protein CO670_30380 [Rhizobium sp. J15]
MAGSLRRFRDLEDRRLDGSSAEFSHYRTKDQDEVDLVIEDRRGRVVGIEVKASTVGHPILKASVS